MPRNKKPRLTPIRGKTTSDTNPPYALSKTVGADDFTAIAGAQREPGRLIDAVLDELHAAVGHHRVDAARVEAARVAERGHRRRARVATVRPLVLVGRHNGVEQCLGHAAVRPVAAILVVEAV